jgi:hypothetical protein
MVFSFIRFNWNKFTDQVDWKLLLFLIFFLDVKLAVKIPAIILLYILQFDFRFGFRIKGGRLPLFYPLIILIALAGLIFTKSYQARNYGLLFLNGIGFWMLCLLAVHQVKLFIERTSAAVIHNTILAFFLLNALISFFTIGHIMWITGAVDPYRYQGDYQKYFIGTGDYIKGLTFDVCTTNAVLNAFGVVYFLERKNPAMVIICMVVLLLTGSNYMNLTLIIVFIFIFIFRTSRDQKSLITVCIMLLIVFMAKVSPQNNRYTFETFKNIIHPQKHVGPPPAQIKATPAITPDSIKRRYAHHYLDSLRTLAANQAARLAKQQTTVPIIENTEGRILLPKADINMPPYQTPTDTTAEQRKLLAFIAVNKQRLSISGKDNDAAHLPGKALAFVQTINFLKKSPATLIAGDGMGNFSSKLAFKATSLGFSGNYPVKYGYISKDFLTNHLDVYLHYFSKKAELHTIANSPFSVYDQLLAEYGLLGIAAFVIFYVGFFAKHYQVLTYGVPLLLLMLAAFLIDYWFEQLSVVVFFELLILLNIKEAASPNPSSYAFR